MKLSVAAFFFGTSPEEHIENTPVRQAGPATTKFFVFGHLGAARLFSTLHCAFHQLRRSRQARVDLLMLSIQADLERYL
jgi:hypothetical protein